jgi:predicted MPP superfamily phosphohydrolase
VKGNQDMKVSRRGFLKAFGQIAIGGSLACFGGYVYATRIETEWLVVERIQVPVKNLRTTLEGFKIVQISDVHLHPYTQIDLIKKAVSIANSLSPALITVTGDYVLQGADSIFELGPVLAGLNARYGVFTILGNHDLWTDAKVVRAGLAEVGLPLLYNEGVALGVGRETIYLAGLDDVWSGQPDLKGALDQAPAGVPIVLLVHEPDFADISSLDSRVSLQLSGHSHGGQVRLPGIGAPILPHLGRKYDQGLYKVNDMWLYTNRGVGVIGPPIRVNCPPEITEITLVGT